jgi:restriction system protein
LGSKPEVAKLAIPDFQSIMRPLLEHLSDGEARSTPETLEALAVIFGLADHELAELLPSGTQPVFKNRIAWAKSYLKQAGLVRSPSRGVYQITERGLDALKATDRIDMKFLEQYPDYQKFRERSRQSRIAPSPSPNETPEELIEQGYKQIRDDLSLELVDRIKSCSPEFFERLVVELLLAMGYGGSRQDAGAAIGRGGDGGIDGIIKEDRLGLDTIYIQAKRWENTVGRPEIQKFAGALQGRRARKGIFITTSDFSREAREYAAAIETKIILIDGSGLAALMIDFDVGVNTRSSYIVKEIDSDYFTPE